MKLDDLSQQNSAAAISKIYQLYFGKSLDVATASPAGLQRALNRVQSVIAECRASSGFHQSEQNPRYLQAMIAEQAITTRLDELGTVGTTSTGSVGTTGTTTSDNAVSIGVKPAPRPHELQQRVAQVKDPKMKELLRKVSSGQQVSPEDQKKLTALAADQLVAEDTPARKAELGQLMSKLSQVINSVKTIDQHRAAEKYANLVINKVRGRVKADRGFAGIGEVQDYLRAIDRDLRNKLREITLGKTMNESREYSIKYVEEDDVWAVVDSVGNRVESFIEKYEAVQAARKLNSGGAKAPNRHRHVNYRGDLEESAVPATRESVKRTVSQARKYYNQLSGQEKRWFDEAVALVKLSFKENRLDLAAEHAQDLQDLVKRVASPVAEGKLDDLKDKKAEKDDWFDGKNKAEPAKKKVAGKQYGGSKQKDDTVTESADDLASLKAKAKELSDKMDAIVKDGGKVGLNDPLSVQYKKTMDKIKKLKSKKVNESANLRAAPTAKLVEFYRKYRTTSSERVKMVESELLRRKSIMESKRNGRRLVTEGEVQQAQVVLAAQDMVDQIQKMIEQASSAQFKDLPALVSQIRLDQGPDQSAQFNQAVTAAMTSLLQALAGAKEQMEGAVDVVTGKAPAGPTINPGDEAAPATDVPPLAGDDAAADDLDLDKETGDITGFGRERR